MDWNHSANCATNTASLFRAKMFVELVQSSVTRFGEILHFGKNLKIYFLFRKILNF